MNADKKITLFLPSLRGGGAERIMVYLANGFAHRGFAVDLVLVKAEGPYLSLVCDQVKIVNLQCKRVALSLARLIQYLRKEKPDAMLSGLNHANVIAILARILARIEMMLVVSIHNNCSFSILKNKKALRRSLVVFQLMKWTYPLADKILGVSQDVIQDLKIIMPHIRIEKLEAVYNPILTPELFLKAEETITHPWLVAKELPVILAVGRLNIQKDFPMLIRAFAQLNQHFSARLIILGEGEERAKLESLVNNLNLQDRVSLPGFVENPFTYMKNASVFVLSSQWEGLPTVLVEAMACGTPVVATDCPSGPREILEDGKWGKLVPVRDVEAMAEAILASLQGETQRPSREILESRFGLDTIIDQYLSILL